MADNRDNVDEFVQAQENQYVQGKYVSKGEPTPLVGARGKALPFALFLFFQSGLFLLGTILSFINTNSFKSLFALIPCAFFLIVGLGYLRVHRERKKQIYKKMQKHKRKKK